MKRKNNTHCLYQKKEQYTIVYIKLTLLQEKRIDPYLIKHHIYFIVHLRF